MLNLSNTYISLYFVLKNILVLVGNCFCNLIFSILTSKVNDVINTSRHDQRYLDNVEGGGSEREHCIPTTDV